MSDDDQTQADEIQAHHESWRKGCADGLRRAAEIARAWAGHYPIDVFPEGESLTAKSAHMARHTSEMIAQQIERAIEADVEVPKHCRRFRRDPARFDYCVDCGRTGPEHTAALLVEAARPEVQMPPVMPDEVLSAIRCCFTPTIIDMIVELRTFPTGVSGDIYRAIRNKISDIQAAIG